MVSSENVISNVFETKLKAKNLRELSEEYLSQCQYSTRLRPETIRGRKETFKGFFSVMPHITHPELLSADAVNDFFKRLQDRERIVGKGIVKKGVKDSTIETYWKRLYLFFDWLDSQGYVVSNPLNGIKKPKPKYVDKKELEVWEMDRILSAITLHSSSPLLLARNIVMHYILKFCGLRKSELRLLQVKDINLPRMVLTVRAETSKSKAMRQLPIHSALAVFLKDYLEERNKWNYKTEFLLVSNNSDRGLSEDGLKHWVKKLNKESGVKFHLHQYRHSFACALVRSGASLPFLQRLMGHTDLRMTQKYLRSLTVEDLRDAINNMTIAS